MLEMILVPIQWRIQDFPEVGAPTLQGGPTFSQKLHEIERISTRQEERGDVHLKLYYVDPPLQL